MACWVEWADRKIEAKWIESEAEVQERAAFWRPLIVSLRGPHSTVRSVLRRKIHVGVHLQACAVCRLAL